MNSFKVLDQKKPNLFARLKGSFSLITNYIVSDIEKKPRSYKIGVFTVFLVCTFLTILYSGIQLTPALFIRLGEDQAGDIDFIMSPVAASNDTQKSDNSLSIRLLNVSNIADQITDYSALKGVTPRWIVPLTVADPENSSNTASAFGIFINSTLERDLGIGRKMDISQNVIEEGQAWLTKSIFDLLGLKGRNILFCVLTP